MNSPDIGEQAISKAVEIGLETQFDRLEDLNINICTNPIDIVQGKLDSVDVVGKGLVVQRDLRTEALNVKTNSIEIDPLKATVGEIEMKHPTDATAKVSLTEADIQRAFNCEYIKEKINNRKVTIDGETLTANAQQVNFSLLGKGKISLEATIALAEVAETKQIAFTAVPKVVDRGNKIVVEDVEFVSDKNEAPEFTQALLESTKELLDLRNFELDGIAIQVNNLDVQKERILFDAKIRVNQFSKNID
ncbi:LmeA family phospholipid-binding protein [Myxosarcina sp. GI1(2024)]